MSDAPRISQMLHPVDDVAAAVDFYGQAFGFTVAFTDADRFAALEAGPIKLTLAGPAEDVTGGEPAASIKVADVRAAVDAVVAAGGSVVRAPEQGPHELRAVMRDPWGNPVIVYGRS